MSAAAAAAPVKKDKKDRKTKVKKAPKRKPQVYISGGSSVAAEQDERAFQKQPQIFEGLRTAPIPGLKAGYARSSLTTVRYWKNIGLGYRVPKTAQTGSYVDKKCPFTGRVSIRGRILRGKVIKTHMKRTVVIRRDYLHFVPKYKRYEKRHKNLSAHASPAFRISVGDIVEVGECRPLSKTVRFNVIKVIKATADLNFKKF